MIDVETLVGKKPETVALEIAQAEQAACLQELGALAAYVRARDLLVEIPRRQKELQAEIKALGPEIEDLERTINGLEIELVHARADLQLLQLQRHGSSPAPKTETQAKAAEVEALETQLAHRRPEKRAKHQRIFEAERGLEKLDRLERTLAAMPRPAVPTLAAALAEVAAGH